MMYKQKLRSVVYQLLLHHYDLSDLDLLHYYAKFTSGRRELRMRCREMFRAEGFRFPDLPSQNSPNKLPNPCV